MNFEIKQDILVENLNYVIRGISNKNIIPILNCIKFELTNEGLYMLSTDNESAIKTFISHDKIDKMPQDVFRPLEVPKAGAAAEDADGQKQHQQTVTDALHGSVDGLNRLPDSAALERLRRLGQQRPHLR